MNAWPYLLVGVLVTYVWRGLGVMLSGRLNADSPLLRWVAAVAYAMLAGLIARLIILPAGPMAAASLTARLIAAGMTLIVYLITRRNIVFGVTAGTLTLILELYGIS